MKVIYVDHDPEIRSYVSMILETSIECQLLEFSSIPECISYLEIDPPDDLLFVLSEVEISGRSGMELLEWFKNNFKGTPFIWISTPENRNKLITRQSLSQGKASGFIPKPFKDDEFFPVIDKVFLERANLETLQEDQEEESFYNLKSTKESKEVDADWDLSSSSKQNDEVADWSTKVSANSSEEEADWSTKVQASNHEEEADWKINISSNNEEVEADWSLKPAKRVYQKEGYKSFKAKRLMVLGKMVCDIYVALSDEKFLQLFKEGDKLESNRLQKYLDKDVEYLYIKDEDYKLFSEHFLNLVVSNIKKTSSAPVSVKTIADLAAFDNIINTVKEIGITGATAELIKESVTSSLDTLSKIKDFESIFSRIYRSQNYISEHSLLISYIAGKIATDTSWNSPQTLEKLSLAAMIHDIAIDDLFLAEQHDLAFDNFDLLKNVYDEKTAQEILDHPRKAADILTSGSHIFSDVENIILQHHEKPDGSGHPSNLSSSVISPLSCLFIIAEKYCHLLIKNPKISAAEIQKAFKPFETGNFKTPLKSFFNVFTQV